MTELRRPEISPASELDELLAATDRDPLALAREICALRENDAGAVALFADMYPLELRFLCRQADILDLTNGEAAMVDRMQRQALRFQGEVLARATGGSRLFDLAELRADLRARGMTAEAERARQQIERGVEQVEVDDDLLVEARERFVALMTEEEELTLQQKILLLEETQTLLDGLAKRSGNRVLRRLAARLWRAANDRVLASRLERVLTRPGAVALEITSLSLLVGLLGLLLVQSTVSLSPATTRLVFAVDAGICVFFIVEFLFKLALAPARLSWFLRNAVTDLIPALPAAMFLFAVPALPLPNETAYVRALRFLRIAFFARYIQALRPLLRLFRLGLFMIRGLDYVVERFSPLLNRNFVFFDPAGEQLEPEVIDQRERWFRALRREHVLLSNLPRDLRRPVVVERAATLMAQLQAAEPTAPVAQQVSYGQREVAVEQAIENLNNLRPDELGLWMPGKDLLALDRVARIINAPLVRSLPFLRKLRSDQTLDSPEERVVDLGRRLANRVELWRGRILFFADLRGILTGPQILDRVATAMVNASKRPAVRLMMFGGLFLAVQLLLGESSAIGHVLERFVATPLLILGIVCLVILSLGRWLQRIAGEAAETLKRTAEAHFIGLLELVKNRDEDGDTRFLAERVFRWEITAEQAQVALRGKLQQIRSGHIGSAGAPSDAAGDDIDRVALLFLHFLDGAILHENDIKTTEQLLANLSLENIRSDHLAFARRDRRRVRRLTLDEGPLFSGPFLWFRFITESVALETAKRVVDYNRHCVPLSERALASPAVRQAMDQWLMKRRAEVSGRMIDQWEPPSASEVFATTEFNTLDFLSADRGREEHIRRLFGDDVFGVLQQDRRRMIREIFGSAPIHQLPRDRRTVNVYSLYRKHLSHGRVMLLPLYWLWWMARWSWFGLGKMVEIVREILAPEKAWDARTDGRAPFAVALRKIHRMKAPGLLEAMATRASFDPAYSGNASTWSFGDRREPRSELERDMDFLVMKEREREQLRTVAKRMQQRVEECHFAMRARPPLCDCGSEEDRRMGERALTIAWATDRRGVRTLMRAEAWFEEELLRLEAVATRVPRRPLRRAVAWLLRAGKRHPVERWLTEAHGSRGVSGRARRRFRAAYHDDPAVRITIDEWLNLPRGVTPAVRGLELARQAFTQHVAVSRDLAVLRTVQSLSVLDVRNYRQLVFQLGGYEDDGEDPALATALP